MTTAHKRPEVVLYAFRTELNGPLQAGYQAEKSGMIVNDVEPQYVVPRITAYRHEGMRVRLAARPSDVVPELLPQNALLVLPFPQEFLKQLSLDEVLNADKGSTRRFPVEHDTRKF
jgi:hypothetical protein